MRKLITVLVLAAIGLSSCGGDDDSLTTQPAPPVDDGTPEIASIDLITDNPQIPSDGGIPATITAFVKDTGNNFVENVQVDFSADSGGLSVSQPNVTVSGVATASLSTAGDPTNRTITVTATAGELSQTIDVLVTGSQLTVSGPDSLVQNDTATYTIVLVDGGGTGIAGKTIDVSSGSGNTLASSTLTTDVAGQAQVDLTATVGGADTLTASGLGLMATRSLTVSNDSFAFITPAENAEVDLGPVGQVVTVQWLQDGVPQASRTINFSTTRGQIVGLPQVITNAAGQASITVQANDAGFAIVTADADNGPSTQLPLEFVATDPDTIEVQSDPFTVAPGNQATITAIVRDPDNNRVKNERVQFLLEDTSGGTLSVGSAETDSQGRAQTFYTANDVISGNQGVTITASVEADTSINDSVVITVARRELFLAFGTGNSLEEPNLATYEVPFSAFVTDSEGNGVPDVNVQFDVRSVRYTKGYWIADTINDQWVTFPRSVCADEDSNGNGILEPGEDTNNNGTIEAGNVVAVIGGDATTSAEGVIDFKLRYAQQYGAWTEIRLRGKVAVAGSEFVEDLDFVLQVLADDVRLDTAPPGLLRPPDPIEFPPTLLGRPDVNQFIASPWGYGDSCLEDV